MRLFEKILCPVDFSENSTNALHWTQYLAKKYNSEVIVLHVAEYYPANAFLDVDFESYHQSMTNSMHEFLAPLQIKHESMLSSGDPFHKITALAAGLGVTLIVMGTAGLQGASHRLLGSTTENVMRTSSVPVLTVSPDCMAPGSTETRRTLMPVARLDQPPRGYIRLRRILRDLGGSLSVMHVVEFSDPMFEVPFNANPFLITAAETDTRKEQLLRLGIRLLPSDALMTTVIQFGDVSREILKEIESGKYDFVLLGARRRTFLSRFIESTAYQVISKSPVPVITVRVA